MSNPNDPNAQAIIPRPPSNTQTLQLSRTFQPITDEAAWALAERIKNSNIIPKDFIGKPENIFIAMLMGREVGLNPMQAVQHIMVVNGRPCMWGDALPALVYGSNKHEKFEEEFDEKTNTAICTVRRKGDTKDHVQRFSWADAIKAGYDKKQGPWQTNPRRMLQMRARAFALRDKFADVLKGLGVVEEVQDYDILENKTAAHIQMPREVVEVIQKAESFAAQETPPAEPAPPTPEGGSEDSRITTAKKKFLEAYKVDGDTIDRYMAWHKLTTFGEIYPRLQAVWKGIKAGTTNVETEFRAFTLPAAADDKGPDDLL